MTNMDEIQEKFRIALEQKQKGKYISAIKTELSKADRQNWKITLEKQLKNIKNSDDFEAYKKNLEKVFDELYEIITAPGVDDFINWINELTGNRHEKDTKILHKYLVGKFSEEPVSKGIENILALRGALNIKEFIFKELVSEIKKNFKKVCTEFLEKPSEFENKLDDFLTQLEDDLSTLSEMEELKIVKQQELYNKFQLENNIKWFEKIISSIVEKSQTLKPLDESEKRIGFISIAKRRLENIRNCINILDKTEIANNSDEVLQNIFYILIEDFIKGDDGWKENNLEDFIDNQWSEIEENYTVIKDFFNKGINIKNKEEWDMFVNGRIKPILIEYMTLTKSNTLKGIIAYKPKGIKDALSKESKLVNEFNEKCESLKSDIVNEFDKILTEYHEKNIPLLKNLARSYPELKSQIDTIQEHLTGLKYAKKSIDNSSDVLKYLNEYFDSDLKIYLEISTLFKKALHDSGMVEHLEWLDEKLNGSETGSFSTEDFKKSELIGELLKNGLIKINIEKTF